jgi:hypothetical protein
MVQMLKIRLLARGGRIVRGLPLVPDQAGKREEKEPKPKSGRDHSGKERAVKTSLKRGDYQGKNRD